MCQLIVWNVHTYIIYHTCYKYIYTWSIHTNIIWTHHIGAFASIYKINSAGRSRRWTCYTRRTWPGIGESNLALISWHHDLIYGSHVLSTAGLQYWYIVAHVWMCRVELLEQPLDRNNRRKRVCPFAKVVQPANAIHKNHNIVLSRFPKKLRCCWPTLEVQKITIPTHTGNKWAFKISSILCKYAAAMGLPAHLSHGKFRVQETIHWRWWCYQIHSSTRGNMYLILSLSCLHCAFFVLTLMPIKSISSQ